MSKAKIKIFILMGIVALLIIYGGKLFFKLSHDKKVFNINLYQFLPPDATELIILNENYDIEKLELYNLQFAQYMKQLQPDASYPIMYSKYMNGDFILLMKNKIEQENSLKDNLKRNISNGFEPVNLKYKEAEIDYYSFTNDKFIVCTFHNGIFAMSNNYRRIENFLDTDIENTFFGNSIDSDDIENSLKVKSPIHIFFKDKKTIAALNFSTEQDSLLFDGYILNNNSISPSDTNFIFKIPFEDSLCISDAKFDFENNPSEIMIKLNKKHPMVLK